MTVIPRLLPNLNHLNLIPRLSPHSLCFSHIGLLTALPPLLPQGLCTSSSLCAASLLIMFPAHCLEGWPCENREPCPFCTFVLLKLVESCLAHSRCSTNICRIKELNKDSCSGVWRRMVWSLVCHMQPALGLSSSQDSRCPDPSVSEQMEGFGLS